MNKIRSALILLLAAILLAHFASSACAQAKSRADKKIIKVGGSWALTGPFALDSQSCLWGAMDYLAYAIERQLVKGITLRRKLQEGYEEPTYERAKEKLLKIRKELQLIN